MAAVKKLAFKVKDGDDAEIQVDDITFDGMTYGDFNFPPKTKVINSKALKNSNMFSVNSSSISFKLNHPENLTVSLVDAMGNQIRSLYTGNTASEKINLNSQNLANGRYLVVISGKNVNYSQPIVIVK